MKKGLLILMLLLMPLVSAANTVTETINLMDEYYYLVLGNNSIGADTLAATEIALGLQNNRNLELPTKLESEVSENVPKIFIGPPCGSTYIKSSLGYDCDLWPYEEGQALIKVDGRNLIITGTTSNDRRRAGLILRDYLDYPILNEYSFILVTGMSLEPAQLKLEKAKTEEEFVCGDNICEPGETYLCFIDCQKKSCFDICKQEGFEQSYCRDIPSNPNVNLCQPGEVNKGIQYCATEKSCCCGNSNVNQSNPVEQQNNPPLPTEETTSFLDSLLNGESAGLIVSTSIIVIIFIILLAFILTR